MRICGASDSLEKAAREGLKRGVWQNRLTKTRRRASFTEEEKQEGNAKTASGAGWGAVEIKKKRVGRQLYGDGGWNWVRSLPGTVQYMRPLHPMAKRGMDGRWVAFVEVLAIGLALLVRVDGSRLCTLAVMDRRCTPKLGRSTVTSIE